MERVHAMNILNNNIRKDLDTFGAFKMCSSHHNCPCSLPFEDMTEA